MKRSMPLGLRLLFSALRQENIELRVAFSESAIHRFPNAYLSVSSPEYKENLVRPPLLCLFPSAPSASRFLLRFAARTEFQISPAGEKWLQSHPSAFISQLVCEISCRNYIKPPPKLPLTLHRTPICHTRRPSFTRSPCDLYLAERRRG